MMDIKVIVCVVLIIVSMANNSQGLFRSKRSPSRNSANGFSSASSYGGAGAFAGATASASSSSGGIANSFTGASANANNPGEFGTNQYSWADNNKNSQAANSYKNNAITPPSTSWMIPPPIQNPSSSSSKSIPSLSSGQARPIAGYTPVISISGSFDTNDPSPNYAEASAICDSNNNCNTNYNPPTKSNPSYSQNNRPITNNYYQPQQYPNQMSYNPKPNYGNTNYGNPYSGNGGFASAGSFASGGNQPSYPGNNEISLNSRFNPDQNWPNWGNDDPFKWVQEQNRAIQASIQSQINQFRQLNNQQPHWPDMGLNDGSAWAWGSASAGPSGGSQAGGIGPDVGPGIESRFGEDVPSPGGSGSYSSFSSSSSSSRMGPDGKVITTKEVTTGVNNNGKVSIKHIKDP